MSEGGKKESRKKTQEDRKEEGVTIEYTYIQTNPLSSCPRPFSPPENKKTGTDARKEGRERERKVERDT